MKHKSTFTKPVLRSGPSVLAASIALTLLTTFLPVSADTRLVIVIAGEPWKDPSISSVGSKLSVATPPPNGVFVGWSTTESHAMGIKWEVRAIAAPAVLLAGTETLAKAAVSGVQNWLSISSKFLAANPPVSPKSYEIVVTPFDAKQNPLGLPSAPVTVEQKVDSAQPIHFGQSAVFPNLELVHYKEEVGQVAFTQLRFARGTLTIRVRNIGKTETVPFRFSATDFNVLMQVDASVTVPALKVGAAPILRTLNLTAMLPPAESQLAEEKQYSKWQQRYRDQGGVDLRGVLDWQGQPAEAPMNNHLEVPLYRGIGDSTPCQEGAQTPKLEPLGSLVHEMTKIIHNRLDCRVVGYALVLGEQPTFEKFGVSRSAADAPERMFKTSTKIPVASVSKVLTALAAIRVLANHSPSISLDTPIRDYVPKDWTLNSNIAAITFAQLLSHKSGIRDYGNNKQDYDTLKEFFTQPVNPPNTNSFNPKDKSRNYSNYNFSIFRILLPMIAGFVDNDPAHRAEKLAAAYVKIVQANVFEPVGVKNVDCKPPTSGEGASSYSFSYLFPGTDHGFDWKDNTLIAGHAGWYLSVEDIAPVLASLNKNDGKILTPTQFADMNTRVLGWDNTPASGTPFFQKNGGWSWNGTSISTSIAILGSNPGVIAALFMNSDISQEPGTGAATVLERAYADALARRH